MEMQEGPSQAPGPHLPIPPPPVACVTCSKGCSAGLPSPDEVTRMAVLRFPFSLGPLLQGPLT